jgi:long-chain acyl-CoA synthetase
MADNIASIFITNAVKNRNKIVFHYFDGSWRAMTFGELVAEIAGLNRQLKVAGAAQGDRVAIVSENSPRWAASYLAVMFAGCVAVPVDTQLGPGEIRNILSDSGCKAVFCSSKKLSTVVDAVGPRPVVIISLESIATVNTDEAYKYLSETDIDTAADDLASIIYTSGTTGNPKGVMLTQRNFISDADSVINSGLILPGDNVLSILPLHHTYPFMCNFMMAVAHPATVTFGHGLKAADIVSAVREGGVTVMLAVPRLYEMIRHGIFARMSEKKLSPILFRIVKLCGALRRLTGINAGKIIFGNVHENFRNIRVCVSGGARLEPDLMRDMEALGFTMTEGYGLTETSPVIAFNPFAKRKPGSIGKPLIGAEFRIDDGEIVVRGPMVMAGYYKNSSATAEAVRDGWFYTGDLGYRDEDGYYFITGRRKEVIVLGSGKNIYPDEIEKAYRNIPLIREIGIAGVGSRGQIDFIQAIIVPDLDYAKQHGIVNISETLKWDINEVTSRMPEYMRIRGFTLYHEPLPRTSLGKLRRFMLKDIIAATAAEKKTGREPDAVLMQHEAGRKIVECVWAVLNEEVVVRSEDNLEIDLGFDSLAKIEFISALEAAFSVSIPDTFISDAQTVGDTVTKIMEITEGKGSELALSLKWNSILDKELPEEDRNKADFAYGPFERHIIRALFAGLSLFFRLYFRLSVGSVENIPVKGPYILAANHTSYLDGFAVAAVLSFPVFENMRFLGISKFFGGSIKQKFARISHVIPIDSERYLNSALQISSYVLGQNKSLCIFPEGGRTFGDEALPFKKGIGILAVERNIPVVPVYIDGAARALPRGAVFMRPAKIRIVFGRPVTVSDIDMDRKPDKIDRYQFFADELRESVIKLRKEIEK